ncbi:putative TIR domain, P-loop containing nucleoside triphosphate hydrolase [Helianthus annuus]|nr:putative TIR domain, P-loop containing nucleoside triphosphate hydrolase [Helianthus annuus]
MASSSTYSHSARASSRSCKYDVFLSFRGDDIRKTFVDHFYSALVDRQIHTYKDDITLPRGDSIGPSLSKAVEDSRIAVVIFSKNYGDSSWCLEELTYIMKCRNDRGLIVMPIFYDVDPMEVRKQLGDFGKAFAKQEVQNITKAESWRKALVDASKIAGWEPKNIANGHESKVIREIADRILDRLFSFNSDVDEDLVGMTTRLQDLKSRLEIGSGGVRMVGIWGIGGSGKTTLAFSLYKEISRHFQGHCIVDNVRVESSKHGLKTLQEKVLSSVLKTHRRVQSVDEGKNMIKGRLCESNVLVLLDDVNDLDQLEALAGSHNWFGNGSRIIITTRDEHLLRTHKVDVVYQVKLLSVDEAIRLFNKHAFKLIHPAKGYETLSLSVVSYAAGLPLALKVLGSFLFDKDKNEWISTLDKLKDIPDLKVTNILKISYDGLETYQKELFLDIACFWRRRRTCDAMEILGACNFYPEIGIEVLRQKALITIVNGTFDMHDLVQEMGHYIVRGEHPNNPEKHSRVWKDEEIINMCYEDTTMVKENDKIEAITYHGYSPCHDHSSCFCKIVSNLKKLRWLSVYLNHHDYENAEGPAFLSNELRHIKWYGYPASSLPHNFQPTKLVVLVLKFSVQKEVWKGCKVIPLIKTIKVVILDSIIYI